MTRAPPPGHRSGAGCRFEKRPEGGGSQGAFGRRDGAHTHAVRHVSRLSALTRDRCRDVEEIAAFESTARLHLERCDRRRAEDLGGVVSV